MLLINYNFVSAANEMETQFVSVYKRYKYTNRECTTVCETKYICIGIRSNLNLKYKGTRNL